MLLLLFFALQSCKDNPGVWKNDQIKAGKREDFRLLSEQVFTDLKANNLKGLKFSMSKELIDNTGIERTVEIVSNYLHDSKYSLLDEYYVVNKWIDADTIQAGGRGINSYGLTYPGTAKEMYIAFYVPNTGNNKYLISTIYAKYNYGWKLNDLDVSPYTINGKTAPELYKLAKDQYDKKYLINAINNMALATTCLKPSTIWAYPDENDMSAFYGKLITEGNDNYKFPFVMSQVPTKPMIIRVYNQTNDNGSFPMVYYMSRISLKDTNAIKRENLQIKKVIGGLMPGIDKDNKYVFYDAFNKKPNGANTVEHFDMVDTLR
jgi:hypothetical protein